MTATIDLIRDLVGVPTASRDQSRDLLHFVEAYLARHGVASDILWTTDGRKGNLWATIGPADRRGVVLSGHSDVEPVDGQDWRSNPLELREADDRHYGRGACDMKGFIAICLALVPEMVRRPLKAPAHLAIFHDEEIRCMGVRSLVERIAGMKVKPAVSVPSRLRTWGLARVGLAL